MTDHITPPPATPTVGSPRSRTKTLRVIALMVLFVLAAEVAARGIEPALPRPAGWPDTAIATKVEQLDDLARAPCTDLVFVGNSMTRDDLDPELVTANDPSGRTGYNASLDAASPLLLERWVSDEVLPATRPATVVIGLGTMDLNDAAVTPAAALRSFDDAPYTAAGRLAPVEAWFTRHLALVRNRTALRDPTTVADAISDRVAGRRAARPTADGIPGVLAADGHGLSRRDLRFDGDEATVRRLRSQFLEPYDIGGDQIDALERLIVDIQDRGAEAVLLVLPVTDAYVGAHPDGAGDVARFRRALERVAADTGAPIVDAPPMAAQRFADTHHLNGAGSDALSSALPGLLADAGVGTSRCGSP